MRLEPKKRGFWTHAQIRFKSDSSGGLSGYAYNPLKFAHVAPRLVPEILNPVDVIVSVDERFAVIDATVFEPRYARCVASMPAISVNNG